MGESKIEWCDSSWNPVTGCTKVSAGCKFCYAEKQAPRTFKGRPFTQVMLHPNRLDQPLHWRKPRRIFVCSMGDLFHEDVPYSFVRAVMKRVVATPHHVYMVLTKRSRRMRHFFRLHHASGAITPNLWLGVSAENQAMLDERAPDLIDTPAILRFLSLEPLLGPLDLRQALPEGMNDRCIRRIRWAIVGGESGQHARPCYVEDVRSVVEQCRRSAVPVFVKQLGRLQIWPARGHHFPKDLKGGNPAEWPLDVRVREWPSQPMSSFVNPVHREEP